MTTLAPGTITPEDLDRHRRELHVHCYRMLASFDEAEDAVQDTLVKAWNGRERFETGGGNLRAWLYTIATNACLDRMRQVKATERSFAEVPWLAPYPDRLLDEIVIERETIELGYLALIQLLPARQRAVLILREVLDWSASETAAALEMTVPAVTSALQRARATIAAHDTRLDTPPSPQEQELLSRFIDAHQRMDAAASLAAVRDDIRITMPPHPMFFEGRDEMARLFEIAREMGEWRLLATSVNRMPAAVSYLRAPGDTLFRAYKIDVLHIEGDRIAETTTFMPDRLEAFELPSTLTP
jgi:RNA polymerase sigma-70 factor (TIGR02960 family)